MTGSAFSLSLRVAALLEQQGRLSQQLARRGREPSRRRRISSRSPAQYVRKPAPRPEHRGTLARSDTSRCSCAITCAPTSARSHVARWRSTGGTRFLRSAVRRRSVDARSVASRTGNEGREGSKAAAFGDAIHVGRASAGADPRRIAGIFSGGDGTIPGARSSYARPTNA